VLESIHKAQFKPLPSGFQKTHTSRQEPGMRRSLPLPYQLEAGGRLNTDRKAIEISMESGKSAGSPFHVYAAGNFRGRADLRTRAYAVEAGKRVADEWPLDGFVQGRYHLRICGPNGFLRELAGSADDPLIDIQCEYPHKSPTEPTGDLGVIVTNRDRKLAHKIQLVDHAYKFAAQTAVVRPGTEKRIVLRLEKSFSWYDFSVTVPGMASFARRCAGRVETGRPGFSDPAMAG
jgi:phospholipase C